MLVLAGRAANPSEASMKSSTIQKGFYRGSDHTSQRSRLGFEPLLVGVDVVVEVLLQASGRRRFARGAAVGRLLAPYRLGVTSFRFGTLLEDAFFGVTLGSKGRGSRLRWRGSLPMTAERSRPLSIGT